jgi:UDP-glucuronate 4-epimerase
LNSKNNRILVTGAAGFIGSALVKKLLMIGKKVVGIDNLNTYYNVDLKKDRLDQIKKCHSHPDSDWTFIEQDISDVEIRNIFEKYNFDVVINLAAQAGVRYSLENPMAYVRSNLEGFVNILECCREFKISNFIYASSSSVYGDNEKFPYSEKDSVDHPISLYAATKKSNELIAHSYSHLYNIPSTGLRFFTVYGPWGRPDMAPMIFAKAIVMGEKIKVFNNGNNIRDFTFIDDVVDSVIKCAEKPAEINKSFNSFSPNPSSSFAPHRIFNVGNGSPIELMKFIETLERAFDKKASLDFYPKQKGDVIKTGADTSLIQDWINYKPFTSLEKGVMIFTEWYKKSNATKYC